MDWLKPSQRKAINAMSSENVQIVACAGSGKTEVISRGIAEIVRSGADPSSIVAFTFTEKAAEELKARIRRVLIESGAVAGTLGDLYAGTIHSYCFEALKEFRPEYRSFDVLDEASRVAYLSKPPNYYKRLNLVGLEHANGISRYTTVSRFILSTEIALNEGIATARLRKADPRIAAAIDAYRRALVEDHYLDFSTMIHELVDLLEHDAGVRQAMHHKVRYLIVDEYQDINGLQERLIKAMVGPQTRITVVGDDDQSIYGWRGAVVDYIRKFGKNFRKVKTIRLQENFRSSSGVVELANTYIRRNRSRLAKSMVAKGPMPYQKPDIQYRHFTTEQEQLDFIARRIRELVATEFVAKDGAHFALGLGDFVILVRNNADIQRLLPLLERAGIEYVVDSGESVFDQPLVTIVLALLDASFGLGEQSFDQLAGELAAYFRASARSSAPKRGILRDLDALKAELDRVAGKKNDYLPELGLQGVFHRLIAALGLTQVDLSDAEHFYLASLSRAVSDYETVWQRLRHAEYKFFRGFVTAWAQHSYTVPGNQIGGMTGRVKIMTIHKAKGLEFPVVFIPYLNKKRKPNPQTSFIPDRLYDAARYDGDEEDDRRVYYVAMTRSQKYLFLSGMKNDEAVRKPREPASVIAELDPAYLAKPTRITLPKCSLPERVPDHSFATTFSELSAYGRCGYDYKLRHLYGYNAGVPAAFGYGTQIHNILNLIHKEYRDAGLGEKEIEALVTKHFYLRYAPGAMSENARRAAVKVVQNYVRAHAGEFGLILETEKRFEAALGDTLINGQIDLIKKIDADGSVLEVEVVDFKSDSALLYKGDSKHQVRLYVSAARDALKLDPKRASLQDLETGRREDVAIDDKEMAGTLAILDQRIKGIRSGNFAAVRSTAVCPECDYCRICRHAVTV
jgi:DNA helicase-2/ATP-dependent DNA helicase PcrA